MPGMDGLQVLEEIRKQKIAPNATIVMLTNESNVAEIEKAKQLAVNGYIVKATSIPSEVVGDVLAIYKENKHL